MLYVCMNHLTMFSTPLLGTKAPRLIPSDVMWIQGFYVLNILSQIPFF